MAVDGHSRFSEPVDRDIAVLGGGLAGLSASYHLGGTPPIYEASDVLGGLCSSRQVGPYTFDYTGHLLHFKVPYFRELVAELLGEDLLSHHRRAFITIGDGRGETTRVKYPFQANLHDLPAAMRDECLQAFLAAQEDEHPRSAHFEQWIANHFGSGIARHFMLPYNRKLWRYPLEQMSAAWIDTLVPQPNIDEVVQGAAGPQGREFGYNIEFAYPRSGGIGRLARSFEPHVGPVHYGARASAIDPQRRTIQFSDGRGASYQTLISSIPLPILLRMLDPCPPEVSGLADRLASNSIININLGVDGEVAPDVHWMYFPDPSFSFYRVGIASSFSSNAPAGKSSLYVEVSFRGANPYEQTELTARVIDDLVRAGLLDSPSQVEVTDYNVLPFAYVIYDLDYSETTQAAHSWLQAHDIHSIGRFGAWKYFSMEQTMLDGKTCAEQIRSAVQSA